MISCWVRAKSRYASNSTEILCSAAAVSETTGRTMETGPDTRNQANQAPDQGLTLVDSMFQCLSFLQPLSTDSLPTGESLQQQNLPSLKISRSGSSNTKTPVIGSSCFPAVAPHSDSPQRLIKHVFRCLLHVPVRSGQVKWIN